MIGKVDFTSGPVAECLARPDHRHAVGARRKEGSKFKLDYVVTENATDPNVPVEAKLVPYNG